MQSFSKRKYLIRGRVQGVGYRQFVLEQARRLDLAGYVRNLPDGAVEAVAAGADLSALEKALRQGPRMARVEAVESLDWQGEAPYPFTVRH